MLLSPLVRVPGYIALGAVLTVIGDAAVTEQGISVFCPFVGVTVALLLAEPAGARVSGFLGCIAGTLLASWFFDGGPLGTLRAVCAAVEIACWTTALLHVTKAPTRMREPADVARIVLTAMVCIVPACLVAGWWLHWHDPTLALDAARMFWTADVLSAIVAAPLVLTWKSGRRFAGYPLGWRSWSEAAVVVVGAVGITAVVFGSPPDTLTHHGRYLISAVLTWAAVRLPPHVAASAVTAATFAAVWWQPGDAHESAVTSTQLFLAVAGVSSLILGLTGQKSRLAVRELQRSRESLDSLARRIQPLEEGERAHLAREIHDVVGQSLTALQIQLGSSTHAPTRALVPLVAQTTQVVRRLAADLRPPALDHLGLAEAIRCHAIEFCSHARLQPRISIDSAGAGLDEDRAIAVFRVVQEALTNVARHARATGVSIDAVEDNGTFTIEIADDGIGLGPAGHAPRAGFGMTGMRERLLAFGGTVDWLPRPGGGTLVRASLPSAVVQAAPRRAA